MSDLQGKTYDTWEQVAGYFDGDGSVSILLGRFTIAFYLDWSDQCKEQLSQVQDFITSRGLRVGDVHKLSNSDACGLRVGEQLTAVNIAEQMVPFSFKKRAELVTLLEYRKFDSITGSEVQSRFHEYVASKTREKHGNRRFKPMPWSYSEGYRLSKMNRALVTKNLRVTLSKAQLREAWRRHNVFGESYRALGESYGVSRTRMWRSLTRGGAEELFA